MKVGGKRNRGYGRSVRFAVRNILQDGFGEGRYSTRASHHARLQDFIRFTAALGINDLTGVTKQDVVEYGRYLSQLVNAGDLAVSTAVNRLSSVNVLARLLGRDEVLFLSPSEAIGRRSYTRTTEPQGLFLDEFEPELAQVLHENRRVGLVLALARYAGCRFREASLMDMRQAKRDLSDSGVLRVSRGTKGGRSKRVPREIEPPAVLLAILEWHSVGLDSKNVIPAGQNYVQWYGYAHRRLASLASEHVIGTRFHDLRSSYACQRWEELTSTTAPCVSRPGAALEERRSIPPFPIEEAKSIIAQEIGHNRTDVVRSYCGRV